MLCFSELTDYLGVSFFTRGNWMIESEFVKA